MKFRFTHGTVPKPRVPHWDRRDATLRELTELIGEVHDSARMPGTRMLFSSVFVDRTGRSIMKTLGFTIVGRRTDDEERQLQQLRFQAGDFLDVAIQQR
mmetsp:Transcript_197/g.412  ORF Transcript_197/g.412 Transcript_197/m.412 type:complete len:99 (-) Transcript_197:59-355(-)